MSCSKHHDSGAADCITRVYFDTTATVNAVQLDSIGVLFGRNSLSAAGLQFTSFLVDTIEGQGQYTLQEGVLANAFYNGLPLFDFQASFVFDQGQLKYAIGSPFSQGSLSPDTSAHQTLGQLRSAFLANFEKDTIFGGFAGSKPSVPGANYRDSCLIAELGYIDASTFGNGVPGGRYAVKAWKVTTENESYPIVYVEDSTGAAVPVKVITY